MSPPAGLAAVAPLPLPALEPLPFPGVPAVDQVAIVSEVEQIAVAAKIDDAVALTTEVDRVMAAAKIEEAAVAVIVDDRAELIVIAVSAAAEVHFHRSIGIRASVAITGAEPVAGIHADSCIGIVAVAQVDQVRIAADLEGNRIGGHHGKRRRQQRDRRKFVRLLHLLLLYWSRSWSLLDESTSSDDMKQEVAALPFVSRLAAVWLPRAETG